MQGSSEAALCETSRVYPHARAHALSQKVTRVTLLASLALVRPVAAAQGEALTRQAHWDVTLLALVALLGCSVAAFREWRRTRHERAKISERAALIESVFRETADGIIVADDHGTIVELNPAVTSLLGYRRDELIGRNVRTIMRPEEATMHDEHLRAHREEGRRSILGIGREVIARTQDGVDLPIHLSITRADVGGRTLFTGMLRDISDQVTLREALQRAKDRAESATRAKSKFLANMSHEIRTPMNGVIGMLELLRETELAAQQREYAEAASSSAHALIALITDILDLSKIEAGRLELERVELDLVEMLEDAIDLFSARARDKGLRLHVVLDPGLPARALGDPGRVRQILLNLVSNAIKFTQAGHVAISATWSSHGVGRTGLELAVEDTGPGVPPDRRKAIFDAFTQAESSTTRLFGGTGLGLAICRELTQRMNGKIGLEPASGGGARFWVRLPLAPACDAEHADSRTRPLAGKRVAVFASTEVASHAAQACAQALGGSVACIEVPAASADRSGTDEVETTAGSPDTARDGRRGIDLQAFDVALIDVDSSRAHEAALAGGRDACARVLLAPAAPPCTDDELAGLGYDAFVRTPLSRRRLGSAVLRALAVRSGAAPSLPAAAAEDPRRALDDGLEIPAGLRVLVAEDDPTNQIITQHMLEKLGCHVEIAVDGLEVLGLLSESRFDVVLMDCQMPNLDGYETTRRLRALPVEWAAIPVVALTASALADDLEQCMRAGMDGYLTKPLGMRELHAGLARCLASRRETARPES